MHQIGGMINVKSTIGVGTDVHVTLPLKRRNVGSNLVRTMSQTSIQ